MNTLLSHYNSGENRVTSSILSVLERLSNNQLETLINSLIGESTFQLVKFENQHYDKPKNKLEEKSIIDAKISASFALYIEAKIGTNQLGSAQVEKYVDQYFVNPGESASNYENKIILFITADETEPVDFTNYVNQLGTKNDLSKQIIWCRYKDLVQGLKGLIDFSNSMFVAEIQKFLILELIEFIETDEKLIPDFENKVAVVAARTAYDTYKKFKVYVCQENRSFQPISHMGFYYNKQIYPEIPKILGYYDSLKLGDPIDLKNIVARPGIESAAIKERLEQLKDKMPDVADQYLKYIVLEEEPSLILKHPVKHDESSAFTQGQRYVDLEKLKSNPANTADLVKE